ncbi:type IV conjugative transfer system protein TraE [Vibrio parahaemolyticus]|nr:type IV conjugative transfer system protein TraE [Vibrio parahaemolyticus]MDF5595848.1 type IV conjugative transfer system protein TraE [Vibrio parahaemolyticus]
MELNYEKHLLSLSKLLNLLLLFGFIAMTLVSVALGFTLYSVVNKQERTLVPPSISQAFTISSTAVDAPYLQMMGDYFLFLKLNVTPKNVARQYGRLLDYVPSEDWSSVQPVLISDAEHIQKNNISSRFDPIPDGTQISLDLLQIKQTGRLLKSVGDRDLPPEDVTYVVQMAYENGVIELRGITKEEPKK